MANNFPPSPEELAKIQAEASKTQAQADAARSDSARKDRESESKIKKEQQQIVESETKLKLEKARAIAELESQLQNPLQTPAPPEMNQTPVPPQQPEQLQSPIPKEVSQEINQTPAPIPQEVQQEAIKSEVQPIVSWLSPSKSNEFVKDPLEFLKNNSDKLSFKAAKKYIKNNNIDINNLDESIKVLNHWGDGTSSGIRLRAQGTPEKEPLEVKKLSKPLQDPSPDKIPGDVPNVEGVNNLTQGGEAPQEQTPTETPTTPEVAVEGEVVSPVQEEQSLIPEENINPLKKVFGEMIQNTGLPGDSSEVKEAKDNLNVLFGEINSEALKLGGDIESAKKIAEKESEKIAGDLTTYINTVKTSKDAIDASFKRGEKVYKTYQENTKQLEDDRTNFINGSIPSYRKAIRDIPVFAQVALIINAAINGYLGKEDPLRLLNQVIARNYQDQQAEYDAGIASFDRRQNLLTKSFELFNDRNVAKQNHQVLLLGYAEKAFELSAKQSQQKIQNAQNVTLFRQQFVESRLNAAKALTDMIGIMADDKSSAAMINQLKTYQILQNIQGSKAQEQRAIAKEQREKELHPLEVTKKKLDAISSGRKEVRAQEQFEIDEKQRLFNNIFKITKSELDKAKVDLKEKTSKEKADLLNIGGVLLRSDKEYNHYRKATENEIRVVNNAKDMLAFFDGKVNPMFRTKKDIEKQKQLAIILQKAKDDTSIQRWGKKTVANLKVMLGSESAYTQLSSLLFGNITEVATGKRIKYTGGGPLSDPEKELLYQTTGVRLEEGKKFTPQQTMVAMWEAVTSGALREHLEADSKVKSLKEIKDKIKQFDRRNLSNAQAAILASQMMTGN